MKTVFERLVLCWCLLWGAVLFLKSFLNFNIFGFTLHFIISSNFRKLFSSYSGYEVIVTVFTGVAVLGMFPYCQLKKGHIAVAFFYAHFFQII